MSKTINNLNKSIENSLELSKYSKVGHTHSYLPLSGDTMTGVITTPNNAQGIKIGDDAVICDRNIANHMIIEGVTTPSMGGITFGSGLDTNIYRGGANILKTDDAFNCVGGYYWNGESLDTRYAAKSHGTHVNYSTTSPKVAGTASVGSESTVARGDHIHAAQTSVSGNAGTATKLATARTIQIGNKSNSFDGSGNITYTLEDIGAAAASHGTHLTIGTGSGNAAAGNHTHSYLPLSGGTMTGNITFTGVTSTTYPAKSNMLTWSGSTDGADIYYQVDASDKGRLVLNTRDDSDCIIAFANNGTFKTTIDNSGNFSGKAAKADTLNTARTLTIGSTGKTFNGSANVSWSLSEIGAAPSSSSSLKTTDKTIVGAINELFQNANNGKQLIASAIGSPLSSSDTFSAMSTKINTMNTNLKNFLVQCGAKIESGKEGLNDLISLLISDSIMLKFPIEFDLNSLPIACGQYHAAVLKKDGTIAIVGYNYSGQLGTGNTNNALVFTVPYNAGSNIIQVACGGSHTVALKKDGSVIVVGENSSGQLGLNTQDDMLSFTNMLNVNNDIIKVACGTNHTLVLKNDGTVWGTGNNSSGQLGTGTGTNVKVLTKTNLTDVVDIIAGGNQSFAIDKAGDVWCTGLNGNGQLGMGNYTSYNSFVKVTSLSNVKQIACGANHTMVLKNDGTVWATGYNYYGQLGLGTSGSGANTHSFTQVSINSVSHIACGTHHSVLVKTDGTLWACGYNTQGQLGLNSTSIKTTFTQVTTNVSNAQYVFCGGNYTYYIRKDGSVWSCGGNDKGQLGIGTTIDNLTFVGLSSSLLG